MTSNDLKHIAVDGTRYSDYLRETAWNVANKIKNDAYIAAELGDKNAKEIVDAVEQVKRNQEESVKSEEQAYQRVLKQEESRAGYINAAILLFATLVFGVLIAYALIILQK